MRRTSVPSMTSKWAGAWTAAVLAAVPVCAACSSISGDPLGSGNKVVDDVDATPAPPPVGDTPDPAFARADGSAAYGAVYDGSVQRTICNYVPKGDAGSDASTGHDGGAASAPVEDGGAYAAPDAGGSCEPLPTACYGNVTCACVLVALGPELPCMYPSCSDVKGFRLYCP
jgi:hypothetical protein